MGSVPTSSPPPEKQPPTVGEVRAFLSEWVSVIPDAVTSLNSLPTDDSQPFISDPVTPDNFSVWSKRGVVSGESEEGRQWALVRAVLYVFSYEAACKAGGGDLFLPIFIGNPAWCSEWHKDPNWWVHHNVDEVEGALSASGI